MKSYQLENLPLDIVEEELQRLKYQTHALWYKESRLLSGLKLENSTVAVDLGCGPGFVTQLIANAFPHLSITGLDVSTQLLEIAQNRCLDNKIRFMQGSAYETGFHDNSQDMIYSRLVFQHLSNPQKAAAEVFRICKPGGKFAILDIDASLQRFYPDLPITSELLGRITRFQELSGGDREVAIKLPNILMDVGFESVEFILDSVTTLEIPFRNFCDLTVGYAKWLCQSDEEIELFAKSQDELSYAENFAFGMIPVIFVCGTKP